MKLKSIEIIESKSRISSVDIFRGFAILPVVLFHFNNTLPFGYLGVDLFFVISGLLVGSILIKQYKSRNKINFFQFVLQRGFKIWPSYYSFFIVGTILGMVLLEEAQNGKYLDGVKIYLGTFSFIKTIPANHFIGRLIMSGHYVLKNISIFYCQFYLL